MYKVQRNRIKAISKLKGWPKLFCGDSNKYVELKISRGYWMFCGSYYREEIAIAYYFAALENELLKAGCKITRIVNPASKAFHITIRHKEFRLIRVDQYNALLEAAEILWL